MSSAAYDGSSVFGLAVKCQMAPKGSAHQVNAFFGVSGTQSVYGGTRGRTFTISGVLVGSDLAALAAARDTLLSYDDGIARVLTDTWGVAWPSVIFTGQFHPDPMGPRPLVDGSGYGLPYHCTFLGLL